MIESPHLPLSRAREALEMEPDAVDQVLRDGATLPAPFYTSDDIARVEDELIWRRSWQPVGVEPELKRVGDYITAHITGTFFDVPVVVVRDNEMKLRAFVNVCRHRAHFVATGHGNRKTLQCTYHGWTYGLDGCLRGVPRQEEGGLPPFEKLGLYPLPLDTWAGYIFVAIDPVESLEEALGEFPRVVEENGCVLPFAPENVDPNHEYVREPQRTFTGNSGSNWKAQNENNIECYHCPTTHTHSFSEMYQVGPGRYFHEQFDRGVYHTGYLQDSIASRAGVTERHRVEYFFSWVWPNMYIGLGGALPRRTAGFSLLRPDGVHGSSMEGVQYRLPGADDVEFDPELEAELDEYRRKTFEEDREAAARVQTGLKSGMYTWGYTLPESERNMRHFYRMVWDTLAPAFS
jgi:phenylpropionate dioxygenase-like ring-hydroxylating dioxygenase large terminal subunit